MVGCPMLIAHYGVKLTPGVIEYFTKLSDAKRLEFDELVEIWLSRVAFEASQLIDYLPEKKSILDIGCGNAAIDLFLDRAWDFDEINLFDGIGAGERKAGYKSASTPWNRVDTAAEFVRTNLSSGKSVVSHYAGTPIQLRAPVDLVYSSWSWGYHYPVNTYIEAARRCLAPNGHLVIDIRHKTNGVQVIERNGFKLMGTLDVTPANAGKGSRYVFTVAERVAGTVNL